MKQFLSIANRELSQRDRGSSLISTELEVRLGRLNLETYAASLALLRDLPAPYVGEARSDVVEEKSLSVVSSDATTGESIVLRKPHPSGQSTIIRKARRAFFEGMDASSRTCAYKLTCSTESIITNSLAPAGSDLVRLRARSSRKLAIGKHIWSADITLIRESTYDELSKDTKKIIKTEFFDSQIGAQHYEVELELVSRGLGTEITSDDIQAAVERACALAYPAGIEASAAKLSPREQLIHMVARIISTRDDRGPRDRAITLKSILNAAVSLTRGAYTREIFPMENYYATDKADGERGLALISADGAHAAVLTDTALWGTPEKVMDGFSGTIYDGEVIADSAGGVMFYSFDCLLSNGQSVLESPFENRVEMLEDLDLGAITIRAKKFARIGVGAIKETVEAIYNRKDRPYPIDGLIFTQPDANYHSTKNYKWKPPASNTIDFLCIRCPERVYGHQPYVLPPSVSLSASAKGRSDYRIYLLFCDCSEKQRLDMCIPLLPFHNDIVPANVRNRVIHFACNFEPRAYVCILRLRDLEPFGGDIHEKVVEMRWRSTQDAPSATEMPEPWRHWDLLRVRSDRTTGNNIAVATNVFANYVDPFPLEALWEPVEGYFAKETEGSHVASNKFRRFIITTVVFNALRSMVKPRILDLGGGRAADFARYAVAGASLVVNFDMDAMAIAESAERVKTQTRSGQILMQSQAARWLQNLGAIARPTDKRTSAECTAPAYIARTADISRLTTDSFHDALRTIGLSIEYFDVIVSSFAFHYFCTSRETVSRIFSLIKLASNPTGVVIITTMDGKKVHDLLKENGGVWMRSEPDSDETKYQIRALYGSDAPMRDFGQMIKVSVPFSSQMYEEPLCNFEAVRAVAEEAGFNLVEITDYSDSELFKLLTKADRALADAITPLDREYTGLFGTMIFKRASVAAKAGRGRKKK